MEKVIQADPLIEHIYIHIPFCRRKCGYCSFYSQIISQKKKNDFIVLLLEEIKLRKKRFNIQPKTIYFGGGTPSLLSAEELGKILSKFEFTDECEISLEINPTNINEAYSRELAGTSINRISFGVQSFIDNELILLGRLHDSERVYTAYELLRNSGFKNVSFDLIYGLPNQTIADVAFSLERMIELAPEHISTYCLSLGKDVPLYKKRSQIPDDETVSEFYSLIREKLISAGYKQYEISNFSKSGFESKHNLCYWSDKSYLGFGPSAAGYLNICHPKRSRRIFRYTNPTDPGKYSDNIKTCKIIKNTESLTNADHEKEFIFLSLRKTEGMNLKEFQKNFQTNFLEKYEKIIDKYLRNKYLEIEDEFIRLTAKAYFVSNEIFSEFV